MIKAMFLIQHRDLPSCRYRVLQYLPRLEAEGIEHDLEEIPKGGSARRKLFRRLTDYDVVFLQKKNFYPWTLKGFRPYVKSLVYDIDDAVMLNDSTKKGFRSWRKEWRFAAVARMSRIVLVVNSYLALLAKPHAKDVRVLPTVVDMSRYVEPEDLDRSSDKVTIGWIGSATTLPYLAVLRPALEEVGRRNKNVQLKLICNTFFDLNNMPVIEAPWSEETEMRDLFSIDIGLAPAIDDPWFRGKGTLKTVQYLAAGRAVVCAPIGSNRDLVVNGETGLWARSPGEWIHQIGRLVKDEALRRTLGEAGRKAVEKTHSLDAAVPDFVKAIKDAASS